jgi:hypothetical protein
MMKVKINTDNNVKLTIPVPYSILRLGCSIITSKAVWRIIDKKWLAKSTTATNLLIDLANSNTVKKQLKLFFRELNNYRGLVLIDIKSNDGTKVLVKL